MGDRDGPFGDVYVSDRATADVRLVSQTRAGDPSGRSGDPGISRDGTTVVFDSFSPDLVDGDTNGVTDVFAASLGALPAEPPSCRGRPATIVGSDGDNRLQGTPGRDVIAALGGADTVDGGGGADLICLGDGDDRANGNEGADRVYGDAGDDRLEGGKDDDRLVGNAGADRLTGARGDDRVGGGADDDRLIGNQGADRLTGSRGDDRAVGGKDDDWLRGGPAATGWSVAVARIAARAAEEQTPSAPVEAPRPPPSARSGIVVGSIASRGVEGLARGNPANHLAARSAARKGGNSNRHTYLPGRCGRGSPSHGTAPTAHQAEGRARTSHAGRCPEVQGMSNRLSAGGAVRLRALFRPAGGQLQRADR